MKFRSTLIAPAIVVIAGWISAYSISSSSAPLPTLGTVHEFVLTTSAGKSLSAKDLNGSVWLLNAFFTNCDGPCPLIMAEVSQLAAEFKDKQNLRILSLSVDPIRDTPTVLQEYAGKMGIDSSQWLLATGKPGAVNAILKGSFSLGTFDNPQVHTTRLILIDENRRVRGTYLSGDAEDLKELRRDLKRLL